MINKRFVLFLTYVFCVINAENELDDPCETDEGYLGVCKYEHTCKLATELSDQELHATLCGYEGTTEIVCCPSDIYSGVLARFFEGTDGVLSSDNVTCHYDGYIPMMCCPTVKNFQQPADPPGCPPLPIIPTPEFNNAAQTVAWEKCVANQRVIDICEEEGGSYKRYETCAVPISSQRISGGEPASEMEFPHMAALGCDSGISTDDDIVWIGGGSLISDQYILTGGHVLVSELGPIRYAFLGSLDKTDIRGGYLYGIIRLIPHKRYSSDAKHDDIALVQLNKPITFSSFIRPICLPVPGIVPESDTRLIAGWGNIAQSKGSTNLLQKAIISEVKGSECNATLKWQDFVWDDATMICAKGWKDRYGITDSCSGDSGGPLMYKVTNREFSCNYVVAGITSWGGVCGQENPASYTRVTAYLDWIVETVWPDEYNQAQGIF